MAALQESSVFDAKTEVFKNDLPAISDAMKSYLTVQLAQELTRSPELTHMRNGKAIGSSGVASPYQNTTQQNLIDCARIILKHINAYEPPSEAEWSIAHPQKEDEPGLERIDAVTDFRVARLLMLHVRKSNGKTTKFFGKKLLQCTRCWTDDVLKAIRTELLSMKIDEQGVDTFLKGWSDSISGEDKDLAELVWATNFTAVLAARRFEREKEIRERTERIACVEENDPLQSIKDIIAAGGGAEEEQIDMEAGGEPDGSGGGGGGESQTAPTPQGGLAGFSFANAKSK
jgi:hypothetical protein